MGVGVGQAPGFAGGEARLTPRPTAWTAWSAAQLGPVDGGPDLGQGGGGLVPLGLGGGQAAGSGLPPKRRHSRVATRWGGPAIAPAGRWRSAPRPCPSQLDVGRLRAQGAQGVAQRVQPDPLDALLDGGAGPAVGWLAARPGGRGTAGVVPRSIG